MVRVLWDAWDPIYQPIMSDFRKTYFRKRPIFSECAGAVSAEKSDLGQSMRNLTSIPVDLVRGRPDL